MTIKFSLNNSQYPITIKYWDAHKVFPDRFGIDLLSLFQEDNLDKLLTGVMLNDQLAIDLMAHYVSDRLDYEALIQELDADPAALQRFKEAWWQALMAFYGPLQRNILQQVLEGAPNLIRKQMSKLLVSSLSSGSSNIEEKQESQEQS